jgi:hypothetical protein
MQGVVQMNELRAKAIDGCSSMRSYHVDSDGLSHKVADMIACFDYQAAKTAVKEFIMNGIARLFQAFLAPAIFVSASGLLLLSINVRLMGMVTRLRHYVHSKHDAAKNGRLQEAEAYTEQISSISKRAELIRRCFLMVLISLAGTITTCLLFGLGIYWFNAAIAAVIVFVVGLICLLIGTVYYMREVTVALSSVRQEARDERFMDLGVHGEIRTRDPI